MGMFPLRSESRAAQEGVRDGISLRGDQEWGEVKVLRVREACQPVGSTTYRTDHDGLSCHAGRSWAFSTIIQV
jgi:hypothetical protein